jgi:molecular chaperone DnaK
LQAKNEADQLVYSAEKSLAEFKDKINEEIRQEITTGISDVRAIKDSSENADTIKQKTEALSKSISKIGEYISKQPGPSRNKEQDDNEAQEDNKTKGG